MTSEYRMIENVGDVGALQNIVDLAATDLIRIDDLVRAGGH